jgi:ABC-type bacteriocin/lantibiotic exporter with double-glycine peptidase domain
MTQRRRFLAHEVLQTSAMDCGPASLKGVLAGLGVETNYERLRDACRTGPDGTSIDAIEDLALSLGLDAYQEIVPLGDAFEAMAKLAPCIAVVKGTGNAPHFVVVWRTFFGFVQIMDPARGRVWLSRDAFTRLLYRHNQSFSDEDFAAWFPTTQWKTLLERRLARLGAPPALVNGARTTMDVGVLDAGARLVERLVRRGALRKGARAKALETFVQASSGNDAPLALPAALTAAFRDNTGAPKVVGAVVLVVRRLQAEAMPVPLREDLRNVVGASGPSAAKVFAANIKPIEKRLAVLLVTLTGILGALALAEMFFLRAAFNAETLLTLPQQRFAGTLLYGVLVGLMLTFELLLNGGVARLGQALELRTRLALLGKLPRMPDSYFRSRPLSDVTHRSQGLFTVRPLPQALVNITKRAVDLVVTVGALAILYPRGIPIIAMALVFGLAGPWLSLRMRRALESRVQNHSSALGQLYLDVLLGLMPLRTHGGQQAIRARQNEQLVGWRRESEASVRVLSVTEAIQSLGLLSMVVLLLVSYLARDDGGGGLLLVVFWALKLPLEARALSVGVQSIPSIMASMERLLEPLTARETPPTEDAKREHLTTVFANRTGMSISVRNVSVQLGVEELLKDVSLEIPAGQHVAIVGSSGAGKSTFFAMLLGLVERREGAVGVDSWPLPTYGIERFRRETVWVDPSVQLWNRSFLDNLHFGNVRGARHPIDEVLETTNLKDLLERMPDGFATELGESGARVSGGEGQRVRLSRALLRKGARLFLLDEAFRGLDRPTRRAFSRRLRERAGKATVLEVTHDVADTLDFERILVIEDGRLVEDGAPEALLADPSSRYAELVHADRDVLAQVWEAPHWKRILVKGGGVTTIPAKSPDQPEPVTERQGGPANG